MNSTKKPHVILVSLDGVRVDVAYSGKFPTLNKLRQKGVTFKNVVAPAPLTPISHASIFTGLFPPRHGIRHLFLEQLVDDAQTLPQLLKAHGYNSHAIVSCPGLHHWYGFNRGFDSYDDQLPLGPDGKDALHTVDVQARGRAAKRASEVTEKGIKLLDELSKAPTFLFLHYFDAHWPYEPPEPFGSSFKDNPYEGEVAYMDQMLGQFLDEVNRRDLWGDLILIVMADHGEDLEGLYANDHGSEVLGHPEEEGHGCLLYDATQMVPLLVIAPERYEYSGEVEEQVRLVDIVPTVLDLLAIETEVKFDGVSLTPHLAGKGENLVGYCETHYPRETSQVLEKYPHLHNLKAVRIRHPDGEFKIIWHLESDGVEVYDLKRDPNEQTNLMNG